MTVQEIMDIAKVAYLNNIMVAKNDSALIKFVFLGVSELYRRFNLSIKSETIATTKDLAMYELRSPDVSMLLMLYDHTGREMQQSDVTNSVCYDYKQLNYKSFVLKNTYEGIVHAVYKASPVQFKDGEDRVELPDAMITALLMHMAYLGHSTINRDNLNEATAFYQRFEAACSELEMQGYKVNISNETLAVYAKGYV